MRSVFDREIMGLLNDISSMGTRVDRIMGDTIKALKDHDFILARQIFESDHYINDMEAMVERKSFNLIALQQPIAGDLRRITASLKVVTDIERVADQCADICEIMTTYPDFHSMQTPPLLIRMFEEARDMFVGAIDSFMQLDVEKAMDVCAKDDSVDEKFSQMVNELTSLLQSDHKHVSQATDYMFIAKYIERIGDHATNIAEWAAFQVTGEHKNMQQNMYDNVDED
ncbi:MAG: phosphate signaling complex protein PhoU [Clostridiaceae bacterium]|nr:phosphate signaling complex protein PhoU [Clostridiaceae bacterium]